eukprot:gnl/Chilomastix_caulleri/1674.p1 GENE.gnl/Chilomastix_caulleri/1674~~gnl/Chilomastix_caulleri/1674.p1  ORF type:complete len:74 (-),score=5.62 gnl/Chilomastix_caulleri/1674:85-306(-)
MQRASVFICLARRDVARSLSITALTPVNFPPSLITGIPPPQVETTTKSSATKLSIALSSTISIGLGEANELTL